MYCWLFLPPPPPPLFLFFFVVIFFLQFFLFLFLFLFLLLLLFLFYFCCVSPWYNHHGWLGVKNQLSIYLFFFCVPTAMLNRQCAVQGKKSSFNLRPQGIRRSHSFSCTSDDVVVSWAWLENVFRSLERPSQVDIRDGGLSYNNNWARPETVGLAFGSGVKLGKCWHQMWWWYIYNLYVGAWLQGRVVWQRPSRFTAKVAESPPVSCNSAQMHWRPR